MLPNTFIVLDSLPLTPNGKIDRKALSAKPITALESAIHQIFPRNEIEFRLVKIWEEILKITPIGVKDNFFSLGGHSLLLITLVARIQKDFHTKLPITYIFENPTIEQFQ